MVSQSSRRLPLSQGLTLCLKIAPSFSASMPKRRRSPLAFGASAMAAPMSILVRDCSNTWIHLILAFSLFFE